MLTKDDLLLPLLDLRTDEVVVTSMGVVRPWGRISDHDLDFASADSAMGHTADLSLGIAIAQPQRKVICLNGDGSMLMTLGTLATIVESGTDNLILFVVENRAYEITGNQAVPAGDAIDWSEVAHGMGFTRIYSFDDPGEYREKLPEVIAGAGPVFVCVRIEPGTEGPISRSPPEESRYLQTSLAEWSQTFRRAITNRDA
jgi:thiamine pyrophosphate-dependent acetolactate synthase large subunit-like protein